jgi:hypothetical protein
MTNQQVFYFSVALERWLPFPTPARQPSLSGKDSANKSTWMPQIFAWIRAPSSRDKPGNGAFAGWRDLSHPNSYCKVHKTKPFDIYLDENL